MTREYIVKRTDNGWIMSWEEMMTDEKNQPYSEEKLSCFEEPETQSGEYEALISLFNQIIKLELPYCKHNEYNISVGLKKDE